MKWQPPIILYKVTITDVNAWSQSQQHYKDLTADSNTAVRVTMKNTAACHCHRSMKSQSLTATLNVWSQSVTLTHTKSQSPSLTHEIKLTVTPLFQVTFSNTDVQSHCHWCIMSHTNLWSHRYWHMKSQLLTLTMLHEVKVLLQSLICEVGQVRHQYSWLPVGSQLLKTHLPSNGQCPSWEPKYGIIPSLLNLNLDAYCPALTRSNSPHWELPSELSDPIISLQVLQATESTLHHHYRVSVNRAQRGQPLMPCGGENNLRMHDRLP